MDRRRNERREAAEPAGRGLRADLPARPAIRQLPALRLPALRLPVLRLPVLRLPVLALPVRLPAAWCLALLLLIGSEPVLGEDGSQERFLAGLRARRLFSLAESFCRQQLAQADATPRQRADLTVELQRILAEQAAQTRAGDQDAAAGRDVRWQAARQVGAEFLAANPQHPHQLLVRVQDALIPLARGELARQEAEVAVDAEPLLEAARRDLREATQLLEPLDKELTQTIAWSSQRRPDAGQLTTGELVALQHGVRYQLGRCLVNQALCYPRDGENWLALLTAAGEQLARPLTQLSADDPLWWDIRLEQSVCHRLLKEYQQAQQLLQQLRASRPTSASSVRIQTEEARLMLAVGRPDQALAILQRDEAPGAELPAEFALVRLETLLDLAEQAANRQDEAAADRWRQQAVDQVAAMERDHGGYWGRRAELLLVRRSSRAGGNLDVLERAAANLYRKGQLDEALSTYDQAAEVARRQNDMQRAFGFGYRAALVEQQRQRHEEAGQRFRQLGRTWPRHPQAGTAHVLGAWNLAQAARGQASLLEEYEQTLTEHLATWPGDASTAQAAIWLAALQENRRRWQAAIDAYRQVPAGSESFAEAVRGAVRCWQQRLAELRTADPSGRQAESEAATGTGTPAETGTAAETRTAAETGTAAVTGTAIEAAAWLESLVVGTPPRWPERWSEVARLAALEAARLRLQYDPQGQNVAERLLRAALQGQPQADADWSQAAQGLLLVAIAGQAGRAAEAQALIDQLGGDQPQRLLSLVQSLRQLADTAPLASRKELATLSLKLVDALQPRQQQLAEDERLRLRQWQVDALLTLERRDQAEPLLRRLVEAQPRNGEVQEAYARFLSDSDRREDLQRAVEQWRRVAGGSRKDSARWWRARYGLVLALFRLGDKQQAAQRIEYLLATSQPDSAATRQQFERLLKQCRGEN